MTIRSKTQLIVTTGIIAWLLLGCTANAGYTPAAQASALPTPTTHPYLVGQTATSQPVPAAISTPPFVYLQEQAAATLTAASGPPVISAITPLPASNEMTVTPNRPGASEPLTVTPATDPRPELQPLYRAVYLRDGPGTNYDIIRILRKGEIVRIMAKDTEREFWYNVALENGVTGWVARSVSEPVFQPAINNVPIAVTLPPIPTPTFAFLPTGSDDDS